jgi:hypothetical protein
VLLILITFYKFTESFNPHFVNGQNKKNNRLNFLRWVFHLNSGRIGLIHGFIHLTMIFLSYWIILKINSEMASYFDYKISINPISDKIDIFPFIGIGFLIFIFGWFVGSMIMGFYLFVTLNLHRWITGFPILHSNEAFSALKIQNRKGFLRFRITPDRLDAFFIGIKDIPTDWKKGPSDLETPSWIENKKEPMLNPIVYDIWSIETRNYEDKTIQKNPNENA